MWKKKRLDKNKIIFKYEKKINVFFLMMVQF